MSDLDDRHERLESQVDELWSTLDVLCDARDMLLKHGVETK